MTSVEVLPDLDALSHAAADRMVQAASEAKSSGRPFSVALSGGSTPKEMFTLLATERYRDTIDWANVHVFWGDERCVPPDDAQSNYRMAHEALLAHVPIPAENIHRMRGELDPPQAAESYASELQTFFATSDERVGTLPRFDLILLGLGDDAHTASLFPGTPAIDELARWVVPNWVAKVGMWRLTLTPPIINAARQVVFLVAGDAKAQPLAYVLRGGYRPHEWPAQVVRPRPGALTWLVDRAAARLLDLAESKELA